MLFQATFLLLTHWTKCGMFINVKIIDMKKNIFINITALVVLLYLVSAALTLTLSVKFLFFWALMLLAFFLLQNKKDKILIFSLKMMGLLMVSATGFNSLSETSSETNHVIFLVAMSLAFIGFVGSLVKDCVKEFKGSEE